jgi:hypothetical protein
MVKNEVEMVLNDQEPLLSQHRSFSLFLKGKCKGGCFAAFIKQEEAYRLRL